MNGYKLRLIDEKISKKLKSSGGILLKGARYCGKTTTAEFHAASVVRFDASEQIRRLGAVQAQNYEMSKWAVGVRLKDNTLPDIEAALAKG
ncbi:MAG: winged helix DNA-binding domain-containing protein [Tannerella sp.]|jgi:hypothetical protein|nr:winged helix DNA-binding domain-containing protein [Tannerella sp.]